jgi:hypothetical protein
MGDRVLAAVSIAASLLFAATVVPSQAQGQLPRPSQLPPPGGQMGAPQRGQPAPQRQQQQQPPQQAAAKPYKPVAVSAPPPVSDQSFEAFRKQLAAVAQRKDRRALAGMVAQNFFWIGEKGDKADKKRPGIDNLAKAAGLDDKDGGGWEMLTGFAGDPTGSPNPDYKDTICAPADPKFNEQEFEAMLKATGTDDGDWGYPTQPGLEMRAGPQPNAPVIEKLGLHFVRVMQDDSAGSQQDPMLRVVSPSGKTGFVAADTISPLENDQLCYVKGAGGWKIAGFIGGE